MGTNTNTRNQHTNRPTPTNHTLRRSQRLARNNTPTEPPTPEATQPPSPARSDASTESLEPTTTPGHIMDTRAVRGKFGGSSSWSIKKVAREASDECLLQRAVKKAGRS